MDRREIIAGLTAISAGACLPQFAAAQSAWPEQNITMIVPFPPGGQADLAARPVAQSLEKLLGRSIVVDNRGGGGGAIGNAATARATPDGYTLLMTLSSLAVLPEAARLFDRPSPYEVTQLAPIARVLADPTLLAVPASSPWKTLKDFVADAKANPGTISYGSSGSYGTLHIAMEMFAASAGIKLLHVPYRGAGPALNDLLSGQLKALASAPGVLKPHVDSGALRVLRQLGRTAHSFFPRPADLQGTRLRRCGVLHLGRIVRTERPARRRHAQARRRDEDDHGRSGDPADLRESGKSAGISRRRRLQGLRRSRQRPADRCDQKDRQGGIAGASAMA